MRATGSPCIRRHDARVFSGLTCLFDGIVESIGETADNVIVPRDVTCTGQTRQSTLAWQTGRKPVIDVVQVTGQR